MVRSGGKSWIEEPFPDHVSDVVITQVLDLAIQKPRKLAQAQETLVTELQDDASHRLAGHLPCLADGSRDLDQGGVQGLVYPLIAGNVGV
jgi:hypothetical protein